MSKLKLMNRYKRLAEEPSVAQDTFTCFLDKLDLFDQF